MKDLQGGIIMTVFNIILMTDWRTVLEGEVKGQGIPLVRGLASTV